MLIKEDFAVIKALKKRGVYVKDIAAEPRTVKRSRLTHKLLSISTAMSPL
jgi:hypothetical protein